MMSDEEDPPIVHGALHSHAGTFGVVYFLMIRRRRKKVSKKRNDKGTLVRLAGMVLMLLSVLALAAGSASAVDWSKKEVEIEKAAVKFYGEAQKGGYKVVSTEELKKWIDAGQPMLIVDTMPLEDSYKKQHIPGAVQFEFPIEIVTSLDEKVKADFEKLLGPDKNRRLVFYCGFTTCSRSHNGAMWAMKLGYTDVYRCPGGIKAWAEADYPVEKAQ